MNKVNKSIGWSDYSLNLITGCLNHTNGLCKGGGFECYAKKLADTRLKDKYLGNTNFPFPLLGSELLKAYQDPFYPRLWPDRFTVKGIPRGSHIFLNDMSDWVGIGIPEEWTLKVLDFIRANPDYTFLTLTKQPQNLPKFSPFPSNCWVGVTATNSMAYMKAYGGICNINAKVTFASLEPLLERISFEDSDIDGFDWLIIGACTGTSVAMGELQRKYPLLTLMPYGNKWTAQPQIEWVQEIVGAADKAGIPVFLKDNIEPLIYGQSGLFDITWATDGNWGLRQELPNCQQPLIKEIGDKK